MTPEITDKLMSLLLFLPPFVFSLSIHEFAHAWTSFRLGDTTAKDLGRLSIDPLVHSTFFGTFLFPSIGILTGGIMFGWAKPVPVDMRNLKNPVKDMALIAAAGPISNVILAIIFCFVYAFILKFGLVTPASPGEGLSIQGAAMAMLKLTIHLNIILAVFNMIPIPPLDGSRIIRLLIPDRWSAKYESLTQHSFLILILLMFSGALKYLAIVSNLLLWLLMSGVQSIVGN